MDAMVLAEIFGQPPDSSREPEMLQNSRAQIPGQASNALDHFINELDSPGAFLSESRAFLAALDLRKKEEESKNPA